MPVCTGDVLALRLEKAVAGGHMLARHEGRIVLVAGGIPGERVDARVVKVQRDVAWAAAVAVHEPHPARRAVNPDPSCGGMTYAHIHYDHQLRLKAEVIDDAFRRVAHMPIEGPVSVRPSPETGYRMRTRLHLRDGRLGSFREGTHEICDVAITGQLRPDTLDVLSAVAAALRAHGVRELAALEVVENLDASARVLHVDDRGASLPGEDLYAAMASVPGVTGVSRAARGGDGVRGVAGTPWVTDRLGALSRSAPPPRGEYEIRRHAPAFFQANRHLTPDLVDAVLGAVAPSAGPVVDLYAGVGLFAAAVAAAGRSPVTAVEGDPISAADLQGNAAPFADALRVRHEPVERFLAAAPRDAAATLIVDPPRTGISRVAMEGILAWRAPRVVYVSCDVATLARDVRRLVDDGYRLSQLDAFDLFPNTPHVEALARLER